MKQSLVTTYYFAFYPFILIDIPFLRKITHTNKNPTTKINPTIDTAKTNDNSGDAKVMLNISYTYFKNTNIIIQKMATNIINLGFCIS